MSKFERILTDDELISATFKAEVEGTMGELRAVEQAVLAKLAEQEPVAVIDYFDGVVGLKKLIDTLPKGMRLYTHPMPSSQGILDSSNAPFTPKTASEMRSFIGMHFDSLQYANPETEEPDEMDRYTLTIHDLLSAFDWAGHYDCDHIADMRKKVPEGWQLVPIEPTEEMINALLKNILTTQRGGVINPKRTLEHVISSAPKYTGESK